MRGDGWQNKYPWRARFQESRARSPALTTWGWAAQKILASRSENEELSLLADQDQFTVNEKVCFCVLPRDVIHLPHHHLALKSNIVNIFRQRISEIIRDKRQKCVRAAFKDSPYGLCLVNFLFELSDLFVVSCLQNFEHRYIPGCIFQSHLLCACVGRNSLVTNYVYRDDVLFYCNCFLHLHSSRSLWYGCKRTNKQMLLNFRKRL